VTRVRLAAALGLSAALVLCVSIAIAATGDISTVAGTGTAGFGGDNGPATAAQIRTPTAVAGTADGGYVFSDQGNSLVRRVSPSGVVTTIAGNGTAGFGGDNGPATSAMLNAPNGLAEMPDGSILIADSNNNRVRRVSPGGTITTVAGGGTGGDNIPATNTALAFPVGLAARSDGSYLIGVNDQHRVRQVDAGGTITTVAGTGAAGSAGDNGQAALALLNGPAGVALMPDGGFLIADADNGRVRRVLPDGTITTVAGTTPGFGGDGGPATAAQLNNPLAAVPAAGGAIVIADTNNNRVRQVDAGGTITTIAGTGTPGSGGDGGAAAAAQLNGPFGVAFSTAGHLLIADAFNNRIRQIEGAPPPPPPPPVTLDDLPVPDVGEEVNVGPVGDGPVLVAIPGQTARAGRARTSQKGLTFVPLTEAMQIPVGSFLDTKRGSVDLVSATGRGQQTQRGRFRSGIFQVLQSRARRARGLTELRLKGSSFRTCRTGRRGGSARAAQLSRRTIRRLRANARGRFRTRGRRSSATVRGTIWTTADRCDGTLTTVRRGRVAVRDFRRRKTVLVRAGKRYLARAPR
jgi:NHL repeat-containing protein